jgi:hypothetical protein
MGVTRIVTVGIVVGLIAGGVSSSVQAAGWDYDLAINQAQSNLTFDITLDTPLGGGSDSDSSPVTGTVEARLDLPSGSFTNIRITELNAALVNDLNFNIEINFFTDFVGTVNDGGLLMDATHGGPGPAVAVSAGAFSQVGNLASSYGIATYNAGILGSGNFDLSTEDPSDVDFTGTVNTLSSQVRITVPIDITFDIMQDTNDLGDARVHGTIVALAPLLKPGDTDGDGDVDLSDLSNLASSYGLQTNAQWGQGNFDIDTDVDLNDLATLAANYGLGETQAFADFQAISSVPEPATGLALCFAAVFLSRFRTSRNC